MTRPQTKTVRLYNDTGGRLTLCVEPFPDHDMYEFAPGEVAELTGFDEEGVVDILVHTDPQGGCISLCSHHGITVSVDGRPRARVSETSKK